MDNFYRYRGIVNLCQTGQLTPEQIAQNFELSQGRVRKFNHEFQLHDEAGLMEKRAPGASPKLTNVGCRGSPNFRVSQKLNGG